MDYVAPQDLITEARQIAVRKASLPAGQMVLRGALAGGILAYATSLAMIVNAQGIYAAYPRPHAIAAPEPRNDTSAGAFVASAGVEPV
jgi:formate/nitrite transporter FocA (FNT family)